MIQLKVNNIAKSFNRRNIFSGIDFTLGDGASLTITGKNGSGKSTLMKIIAGVLAPTKGTVDIIDNIRTVSSSVHYQYFGFVSPYLQLYDEFTGFENIQLVQEIRAAATDRRTIESILSEVGLGGRGKDLLRTYSSGMKQRLKYAAALIHAPHILLLDEPTSNLDEEGKALVHSAIAAQKKRGIVIIATNEREELSLCESVLTLGQAGPAGAVA